MQPRHRVVLALALVIALLVGIGWWLLKDAYVPVLQPSGEVARQQYVLILFTVILSIIVVGPVFTMLFVFAYKYRAGNKKAKYTPKWSNNKWLEITWWGIPIAIIAVLSVVTFITSHTLDPYRPIESNKDTLEVKVLAVQWKWIFMYPDEELATVDELVIPKDRPVRFLLSADAPMSAFWIPALGSQIYNMNGMTSQLNLIANETGVFQGYSTNINGEGYARMTFDVKSVTTEEYDQWVIDSRNEKANKFTMKEFEELAKPSVLDKPRTYVLADVDVYDKVVAKYMEHMGHGGHHMSSHEGHDMSSMKHNHDMSHEHSTYTDTQHDMKHEGGM